MLMLNANANTNANANAKLLCYALLIYLAAPYDAFIFQTSPATFPKPTVWLTMVNLRQ